MVKAPSSGLSATFSPLPGGEGTFHSNFNSNDLPCVNAIVKCPGAWCLVLIVSYFVLRIWDLTCGAWCGFTPARYKANSLSAATKQALQLVGQVEL